MQLKKILVSLGVLLCFFCTSLSTAAYADTAAPYSDYGVSTLYEIADSPYSKLSIENGTATCTSFTSGTNVAHISVTHTLQKYWGLWIWNDVKDSSRSKQVDGSSIRLSDTQNVSESGTYRLKSVFTLTDKQGKTETVTIYSSEVKV